MIQFCENSHFFLNRLKMIFQLVFIENFNSYLVTRVVFVVSQEHFAKCARTEDFCVVVDLVILFELLGSLFFF